LKAARGFTDSCAAFLGFSETLNSACKTGYDNKIKDIILLGANIYSACRHFGEGTGT
jgi:hypothetical protein